jgi:hypothetical protein
MKWQVIDLLKYFELVTFSDLAFSSYNRLTTASHFAQKVLVDLGVSGFPSHGYLKI